MNYIGEHLILGKIAHFAIVLSFVAGLLAATAYFFATQKRDTPEFAGWRKIGRYSFLIHCISVLTIIGTMLYVMSQQYYEYHYVWQHVSEDLPFKFIFSAFWEGQEGSFLLWMFWHVVLGIILLNSAKNWEAPTMSMLALVQAIIAAMLLGIYFGDFKLGSNPMLLTRDVMNIPLFKKADYLTVLKGNGLNPLLQNYWMTIHPPTLFLGFASTVIPFCYAIAGLWTRQHSAWLKPVLPWALFSSFVLGLGILMGGAWAYEALSFGGYWAWDPVENMSLVPWLILIGGIHGNLIAKNTGHSIKTTYWFYLLSFILVLYSTFLTRSGALGDTSVHAFTEMGLEAQLTFLVLIFTAISCLFYFTNRSSIPVIQKEEASSSKEFWMFIGVLVLLFSAILITFTTSIPVYKKVASAFGISLNITSPLDPITHYNKYQLWIAIFIGLLSGVAQFLRYKEYNFSVRFQKVAMQLGIVAAVSAVLTFLTTYWINAVAWQYILLLFFSYFTIVSNLGYFFFSMKMNTRMVASAMSHVGFGVMVIGIMASSLNKEFISTNTFAQRGLIEGFTDENYKRNILLLKGVPMLMSGYEVTYTADTLEKYNRTFTVNYKKKDKSGKVIENFDLHPNIIYAKDFTKVAASNPSTVRYLKKDIFTHIASLPRAEIDFEFAQKQEDSLKYQTYSALVGDTIFTSKYYAVIKAIDKKPTHRDYKPDKMDLALGLTLVFKDIESDSSWTAKPVLVLRGNVVMNYPDNISNLALKVRLKDEVFDAVFTPETKLNYQQFTIKEGQTFTIDKQKVTLIGFNKQPEHPYYTPEKGDIAVGAVLMAARERDTVVAQPVYLIRGNKPFNIKDEMQALGMHFRIVGISPQTGDIQIMAAKAPVQQSKLAFEIAEGAPRTDYIVMEAILFPGINLFWGGSLMMLFGLLTGMFIRKRNNN